MNLAVRPNNTLNNFRGVSQANKTEPEAKNPISRKGEAANLAKATFLAGVGLGGKLLFELLDDDFVFEHASKTASKMVDKNKEIANPLKKSLCKLGGTVGLIAAGVGLFATAYTLFKSPEIAYNSKINTFEKKNNLDVFVQSNKAQKGIYEQMNEKAQNADDEEKEKLKEQYMQMQIATNSH